MRDSPPTARPGSLMIRAACGRFLTFHFTFLLEPLARPLDVFPAAPCPPRTRPVVLGSGSGVRAKSSSPGRSRAHMVAQEKVQPHPLADAGGAQSLGSLARLRSITQNAAGGHGSVVTRGGGAAVQGRCSERSQGNAQLATTASQASVGPERLEPATRPHALEPCGTIQPPTRSRFLSLGHFRT